MSHAGHIVASKGEQAHHSISPDAMVYDAVQHMADNDVGALVVMEGDKLVGIVTERDYARKIVLQGKSSKDTPVREIMNEQVICVGPQHSVDACTSLMAEKGIRHLVVVDGDRVVGEVSMDDLVKSMLEDREVLIEQLEHYITGR